MTSSDTSKLSLERLLLFISLAACIALGGFFLFGNGFGTGASATNTENDEEMANLRERVHQLQTAMLAREEQEKLSRVDLIKVSQHGKRIHELLDDLEKEAAAWQKTTQDLLESNEGKRIAASADATTQFHALYTGPLPEPNLADDLRRQLEPLTDQIESALAAETTSYKPDPQLQARLDEIDRKAGETLGTYRGRMRQLQAILALAPATPEGDADTLRAAIQRRQNEVSAQANKILEAELERLRRAHAEDIAKITADAEAKLKKAQAELDDAKKEREAARLSGEAKTTRANTEAEKAARKLAQERAELERRFEKDLAAIKSHLQPFLQDGYAQPSGTGNKQGAAKGPVSFSKLEATGALKADRNGMQRLMYLATISNDRDRGGFPLFIGGDFGWERTNKEYLAKAQKFLIDYGDLMVEKGMLAP